MPSPGVTTTLRGRFGLRAFVLSLIIMETLAIASGLYWRSHLLTTTANGLRTHVESIASELGIGLADALVSRTDGSIFVLPAPETGVQILSSTGSVLAASPGLVDQPPLVSVAALASDRQLPETVTISHPTYGHAMVATKGVEIEAGAFVVEAIASLAEVDRTCRIMCIYVPTALILVALAIGWAVFASVDSALRPVQTLARRAAEAADRPRPVPLRVKAHTAELKELTSRLDHLLEAIQASFEREQSFLDDASHELRTPIAVALTEIDLALRAEPDAHTSAALTSAQQELRRLDHTAASLLVLARERSTGLERIERLDLGVVAEDAARSIRRDPNRRAVRIEVTGTAEIDGDPLALERVFTNLIANGVEHCTVVVEVRVDADSGQGWATIEDDGPGIPDHLLPGLFYRYTRNPDRRARSTGLGTAIAAEIVGKHGGTIEAGNRPGGGAVITIRLPRFVDAASDGDRWRAPSVGFDVAESHQ